MLIFAMRKKINVMEKDIIEELIKRAENAAYAIVCKMIDAGYVESEPEGKDWEYDITKIIRDKFGF